ncbi:prenyltransferase/squalene oxidase repeat-containing protein [Clostridium tetani]|uniref:prenyltransferase/squalene oxidase repeat-containing protein n=1 Tax=Clostridium tetani TaxID=1513 RepID=UPI0003C0DA30|nr:prenyltransferase/squalene oxidase repeat-containing protein [Clostridium tetani]CDI48824.1 surface/cell-adhesion protein [Clostridium tetani 12124569]
MFKKKQVKGLLCMLMTFLMVFTTVDTGILGMKRVFAEAIKKESIPKEVKEDSEEDKDAEKNKSVDTDKKQELTDEKSRNEKIYNDKIVHKDKDNIKTKDSKEYKTIVEDDKKVDEKLEIKNIVNKIQSESIGTTSIKIVNDLSKVKVGNKIELEVKNDSNVVIPTEKLSFTVSNEKLGRMDQRVPNKFITLGSGTIAIEVALKDKPNIKDKVEFQINITVEEGNYKEPKKSKSVKEQIDKNLAYILKNVENPSLGTGKGEWSILCLARGNYPVPKDYYDKYHKNVVKEVQNAKGNLHKVKYTEHSRLILGLASIGRDVKDVGGYNQLEKLADFKTVIRQGINGPIFALIALDTHNYEIPIVDNVKVQTTRDMLVQYILDKEIKKGKENAGGWALYGETPDPDITAMAIQGLTPYYKGNPEVKAAVDRAISWLSSAQKDDGGYSSWGSINSESIAQVIVALTGLGINPHTDSRFIKKGNSAIDALLTFADPKGGFMHVKPGGNTNGGAAAGVIDGMATDQGTYALIAYDRFVNSKNRLYDMTDVIVKAEESHKPENFKAKRIGEENLKKNSSTQVKFDVENISKEDEEVALAIVLYDKNTNEMINYSYVKKILKSGKKEVFAAGFITPEKGHYLVKAIICDDLNPKKMNVLADPIKIEVE